jgi:hypothetical protein
MIPAILYFGVGSIEYYVLLQWPERACFFNLSWSTNEVAMSVSSRGGQRRSYSSVVVSSGPHADSEDGCGLFTMVSPGSCTVD